MKFDIDKQTINDLELVDRVKGERSVFSFFNYTRSIGGKRSLENLFSNPLTDIRLIEERIEVIRYYMGLTSKFDVDKECLDFIEYYLLRQNVPNRYSLSGSFLRALRYRIKPENEYYIIQRGIRYLIVLLNEIHDYAVTLDGDNMPEPVRYYIQYITDNIGHSSLNAVLKLRKRRRLYPFEFGRLDYCFRKRERIKVRDLLEIIYTIDVYQSVAYAAAHHGFTLPVFTAECNTISMEGLFHPLVENPVPNDFEVGGEKNVCFITGPNMAGKSTLLKALGISVYLAHLGFPVPARHMKTSKFNGLLTTINLSDNINKGYSHFYGEVLRVKYVAERLNHSGNILVVFDELFRGTNVRDAYEASLSVISAFSKINRGVFLISTHIFEVAAKLCDNNAITFKYFEANMIDETPHYSYKIKDGVTDERIGMYIIKKEKVIETIENANGSNEIKL